MNDALFETSSAPGVSPAAGQEPDAVLVTFQIGYQQYALPLAVVLEVVRLPALITLAGSPPTLCGLLNLRGQYLPILDGRVLVGDPAQCDLTSQIVIAGRERPEVGLLVDQVREVCTVAPSRIRPINRSDIAAFLTGVADLADGSVLLFDLAALLALAPSTAKRKAKARTPRRAAQAAH
jgi:purine-binding chemotaxis protein CheW